MRGQAAAFKTLCDTPCTLGRAYSGGDIACLRGRSTINFVPDVENQPRERKIDTMCDASNEFPWQCSHMIGETFATPNVNTADYTKDQQ